MQFVFSLCVFVFFLVCFPEQKFSFHFRSHEFSIFLVDCKTIPSQSLHNLLRRPPISRFELHAIYQVSIHFLVLNCRQFIQFPSIFSFRIACNLSSFRPFAGFNSSEFIFLVPRTICRWFSLLILFPRFSFDLFVFYSCSRRGSTSLSRI